MIEHKQRPVLAVLIDAENVPAKIADGLFEEIAKYGYASVRRAYGDFSTSQTAAWAEKCARHAIAPQHSGTYGRGKNAADIALVIDGMDLLHSGRFDGFCLVSTDSDFVGLAIRIREQGLDVFGFGGEKTPERFDKPAGGSPSLRTSCIMLRRTIPTPGLSRSSHRLRQSPF